MRGAQLVARRGEQLHAGVRVGVGAGVRRKPVRHHPQHHPETGPDAKPPTRPVEQARVEPVAAEQVEHRQHVRRADHGPRADPVAGARDDGVLADASRAVAQPHGATERREPPSECLTQRATAADRPARWTQVHEHGSGQQRRGRRLVRCRPGLRRPPA